MYDFLDIMVAIVIFLSPPDIKRIEIWPYAAAPYNRDRELMAPYLKGSDGWCIDFGETDRVSCIHMNAGKMVDEKGKVFLNIKDNLKRSNGTNYVLKPWNFSIVEGQDERTIQIKEEGKVVRELRVRTWKSTSGQPIRPETNQTSSVGLPSYFANEVAGICPHGWQVSASNNVIVIRRETAVLIMGKVSNPPRRPDESLEHYFRSAGDEIHYEVRLRFVPLLPRPEYEKLRAAREHAAAKSSEGETGKHEYTQWQRRYEESQVPAFFTKDYSIFLDRWADKGAIVGYQIEPRFIEVYPPEAASEIEAVIKSLRKVFVQYGRQE